MPPKSPQRGLFGLVIKIFLILILMPATEVGAVTKNLWIKIRFMDLY